MRKEIKIIIAFVAMASIFGSCAKAPSDDIDLLRKASFEAWMSVYAKNAMKDDIGIYIEKLASATDAKALSPVDGDWIEINYVGRQMSNGNVFSTRFPDIAKQQGTFQYYTHYVPQYIEYNEYSNMLVEGQYLALAKMKPGDKWRLYIPSYLAYGSNGYIYKNGYNGQFTLGSDLPVIIDLELVKVVKDPKMRELDDVRDYASSKWNMSLVDTVRNGLYLQILHDSADTVTIKTDSIVSVYYVGRFMDGFVFDTNIADSAKAHNIYSGVAATYEPTSFTIGDGTMIDSWDLALKKMTFGDIGQMITISTYGYGATGKNQDKSTVIQPYSPLVFSLFTSRKGGNGSEMFPYQVEAIQLLNESEPGIWAEGYIVGAMNTDSSTSVALGDTKVTNRTNILIGTKSTSVEFKHCIVVELPEGAVRNALNLVDNPKNKGVKVRVFGNADSYYGVMGVKDVTKYKK